MHLETDRLLMLSFMGRTLPTGLRDTLRSKEISGVTLFRPNNYSDPRQLRDLTDELQSSRSGPMPLLVAIDQEGGQLHAFGAPATMWPGNMALGAADDVDLTERVGAAIGRELRAVGINVDYAPVADLSTNPSNPATGIRAFGDDPTHVARHVAAMIRGIQSQGVAATMKHFPGKGSSEVDSHHAMPVIRHSLDRLHTVELVPFVSAIDSGVKLAMTGHFALPSVTGSDDLPCTVAYAANTQLLRSELGFEGPLITDALDMKALAQGSAQVVEVVAAVRSGVDLLLLTADPAQKQRVTDGLDLAVSRELISPDRIREAAERVADLKLWVDGFDDPPLDVVGSSLHADLCLEAARRSITVVKNEASLLPLSLTSQDEVLVIEAPPRALTPADTSDLEEPSVGAAINRATEAKVVVAVMGDAEPPELSQYDVVIIVTDAAHIDVDQAAFVRKVDAAHEAVIAVARRTPYDILEYPQVHTYLCCWSINGQNATAVAEAVTGAIPTKGKLPVPVGPYPRGHGIEIS